MQKLELPSLRTKGIGGFGAKISVLSPEGVHRYAERTKTKIENDYNFTEKFAEFQPQIIFFSSLLFFELSVIFFVIFACAKCASPLSQIICGTAFLSDI